MLQKQFVKHTGKLGAERKLVESAGAFQQFQFDEATERSKQVIRLTVDGWVGGRVNAAFCFKDL
jgi:hypothetical protein